MLHAVPCDGWVGIRCDNLKETVIELNLTAVARRNTSSAPSVPTFNVLNALSNLSHLETLVLSNLGLSGPLDDPTQPALGLHTLRQLQHLDISGNPGITGSLPDKWFGLTALQVLDVSGTGIAGTLPSLYASMQDLQEFKAVDCPGISGQLPAEYGLLNLKVLQLTNTALSGTLPSEWANPVALQRMAIASAAALQAALSDADGGAAVAATARGSAVASAGVPIGLQGLRVLDLSVSGGGRGGLSGSLPGAFAAMKQLEVRCEAVAAVLLHVHMCCCCHELGICMPQSLATMKQLEVR
jgi:hypothetical protein